MPQLQLDDALKNLPVPDAPSHAMDSLARASIAHELGNLIQIASSAINIVSRCAKTGDVSTFEFGMSEAKASLDRAGVLVRQSLGRAPFMTSELEVFDVVDALVETRNLVEHTWAPRHRIEIENVTGLPAVKCQRMALQGALLNLALNARDSMPDGGVIILGAARGTVDPSIATVELRVTDTGIGMTPETLERALDPFFTTKSGGLGGVGLSMVKQFVEDAGGWIKLSSIPAEGTTVTLLLPAVQ